MRKAVFRRTCAASIPSFRVSSQFLRPAVGSDPLRSTSRATRLEDKTLVSKALLCTATTGRDNYPSSSVGCLTPVELINVVKHSYCLILNRPEFIQDGNRRADDQQSVDSHHNDITDTICAFNRALIIGSGLLQPSLSKLGGLQRDRRLRWL